MNPELVIFDCDGVLVNSERLNNTAICQVLGECGIELSVSDSHRLFIGSTNQAVAALAERHFGVALPGDFVGRVESRTHHLLATGPLKRIPHAKAAVKRTIAAGHRVCVASNGEVHGIEISLGRTGLLDLFDGNIFSKDQVAAGKPAPDLFLFAASRMGVAPEQACVVEDSIAGVTAAVAAGMPVYAYCPPDGAARFEALGANAFADMRALPRLLAGAGA